MKIVLGLDCTSSMAPYFARIRAMILSLYTITLAKQGDVRIGLIKFRSSYDDWKIKKYDFTQNRTILRQWLYSDEPGGVCPNGCEAVGDALYEALQMGWRCNNRDQVLNKKMVILITDGAPNGLFKPLDGEDPWIMSDRFKKQNIFLVVIGVGNGVLDCDDFYCALAQKTGGAYIPWVNAERILSHVIRLVINEKMTLDQAFRYITMEEIEKNSSFKYSYMESRVNGMINECQTMNDIQRLFYRQ